MENLARFLSTTLKQLRQQRGWSLSRLAEATGVSKAMLGQIERNESSPDGRDIMENCHRVERTIFNIYFSAAVRYAFSL
ncbi:helix-turn-helix transcriptional regulator [Escherichia coli]|nr:helix-turn-helix transcriptional regulator [Escherichia coli]